MALKDRLNKLESNSEERKVNLRMPKNKVDLIEKLAIQYGTNISTLIREMVDNSIIELQKEFVLLDEQNGLKITREDESTDIIRYLPEIVEYTVPELRYYPKREDFPSDEEYEDFVIENARYCVEYGNSLAISGITNITKKEYSFESERYKKLEKEIEKKDKK